jgi:hypothetical protein
VPLTTVSAAANALTGAARSLETLAWVTLPGKGARPEGQFVARMTGEGMEPRIRHRALCLFGPPGPPPYRSRVFLVKHPALDASGSDATVAVRQIATAKRGGRNRVTLVSPNPNFSPVVVEVAAGDIDVIAEVLEILVAGPSREGSAAQRIP